MNRNVVVVGASPKEERYSNKAVKLLAEKGYNVIPVNPAGVEVCGIESVKTLSEINEPVDTVTMYVNSSRSDAMKDDIIAMKPRRIIFNPGAENESLAVECAKNGILTENACTLILLNTEQF
jgi:predicted CoA-binding protein